MDSKLVAEDTIRQYLLGVLPESELSEMEQKLLSSEELCQTADLIEDEILEQYLDKMLSPLEQKAVETHFLLPQARREKLRFARLLRYRFELPDRRATQDVPRPDPVGLYRYFQNHSRMIASALLGVSILLGVSSIDLMLANSNLKTKQESLQAEVAKERKRSAIFEQTVQTLQSSSIAHLDAVYGVTRGSGEIPKTTVQPMTHIIKVELLLPNASSGVVDVHLMDRGQINEQEIWSKKGLTPVSSPPLSRLVFDMPSQGIRSGTYDLVVSSSGGALRYPFDAAVVQ